MKCLYEDEKTKQCINPYCFYKGMGCPVRACQKVCTWYIRRLDGKNEIIRNLRCCVENDCRRCTLQNYENEEYACYDNLMEAAVEELERLTKEKE